MTSREQNNETFKEIERLQQGLHKGQWAVAANGRWLDTKVHEDYPEAALAARQSGDENAVVGVLGEEMIALPSSLRGRLLESGHEVRRPIVTVRIGKPGESGIEVSAIVDTGTRRSFVTQSIADELKLERIPNGWLSMSAPGYSISVPRTEIEIETMDKNDRRRLPGPLLTGVVETIPDEAGAVLGRDVLRHCLFVYHGRTGSATLMHAEAG